MSNPNPYRPPTDRQATKLTTHMSFTNDREFTSTDNGLDYALRGAEFMAKEVMKRDVLVVKVIGWYDRKGKWHRVRRAADISG